MGRREEVTGRDVSQDVQMKAGAKKSLVGGTKTEKAN